MAEVRISNIRLNDLMVNGIHSGKYTSISYSRGPQVLAAVRVSERSYVQLHASLPPHSATPLYAHQHDLCTLSKPFKYALFTLLVVGARRVGANHSRSALRGTRRYVSLQLIQRVRLGEHKEAFQQ